jgi:hypothetical protein
MSLMFRFCRIISFAGTAFDCFVGSLGGLQDRADPETSAAASLQIVEPAHMQGGSFVSQKYMILGQELPFLRHPILALAPLIGNETAA